MLEQIASKIGFPAWLGGRRTPASPPILVGHDCSILEVFRREGRGVVWERQQPEEIKQYMTLLGTKYSAEINRLDQEGVLFLDIQDSDKVSLAEGERKPIPVIGRDQRRGYLDDVFPGTADEKRAYLTDIEARARDAARLFAEWRRKDHPLTMLVKTERKAPFPLHPHSFPVMALNHTSLCTLDEEGKELFSIGSVGIIEPKRLHRSPDVQPGTFRYFNALCYTT